MNIDKYKNEDGIGYTYKDCYHKDAESLILCGILDFCGCGMPDEALEFIRQALQLVYDLKSKVHTDQITFEEWKAQARLLFKSDGGEYFTWYVLDQKEFIEHGSAVPGWLTEKGLELLSDLNELDQYNKENQ